MSHILHQNLPFMLTCALHTHHLKISEIQKFIETRSKSNIHYTTVRKALSEIGIPSIIEKREEHIQNLHNKGHSLEHIALLTGFSTFTLTNQNYFGASQAQKERKTKAQIHAVEQAICRGYGRAKTIEAYTGIAAQKIAKIAKNHLGFVKSKSLALQGLENMLANGERNLRTICTKLGRKPSGIFKMVSQNALEKKYEFSYDSDIIPYGENEAANTLIFEGAPLREIGKLLGDHKNPHCTKEMANQYIQGGGFRAIHQQTRAAYFYVKQEEKEPLKKKRGEIIRALKQRTVLIEEDPVERLVRNYQIQYRTKKTNHKSSPHYPKEKLQEVFTFALELQRKGTLCSYAQIAEECRLGQPTCARRILLKGGIQLNVKGNSKDLTENQKAHITQIYPTEIFSPVDLSAVFPKFPVQRFQETVKGIHNPYLKIGRSGAARTLMEAYAAHDEGLTAQDISFCIGVNTPFINRLLQKRDELAPLVIRGLQRYYGDESISTPYVSASYPKEIPQ